jgi:hypothetical protein
MLQIFETVTDARGRIQSRDPMILVFGDRDSAAAFVQDHVERLFARGKCGYDLDGDYWWGCDEQPQGRLHRYTIED